MLLNFDFKELNFLLVNGDLWRGTQIEFVDCVL